MRSEDLRTFFIDDVGLYSVAENDDLTISYQIFLFDSVVHSSIGTVALELWMNPHLVSAPSYVMNPIFSLLGETLMSLEVCSNDHNTSEGSSDSVYRSLSTENRGEYLDLRGFTRNLSAINYIFGVARPSGDDKGNEEDNVPAAPQPTFEPSEDTVCLMMEIIVIIIISFILKSI